MAYCSDCEEKFDRGLLCPTCGATLEDSRPQSESESESQSDEPSSKPTASEETPAIRADGERRDHRERRGRIPTASPSQPSDPTGREREFFEFAFLFPLGKGGKPLLIDSILVFFSFLLIPLVPSYGYSYRTGRAAARGDEEPPSIDDWGGLTKDGLYLVALFLGGAIVLIATVGLLVVGYAAVRNSIVAIPYLVFGGLFTVATTYIGGAIVPVLIGTGSLEKTFENWRFVDFAFSIHYLKGIVLLLALSVISGIGMWIVATVLIVTVVGILLLIPLYYVFAAYTANMSFAVWGYIYSEAAAAGDVPPVEADDSLGID